MTFHEPTFSVTRSFARLRVALIIFAELAVLLAWAVWMGLGAGGRNDYTLFFVWGVLATVGIYCGNHLQSPIWGAVVGGLSGNLILFGYWNLSFTIAQLQLAFTSRSIAPLFHSSDSAAGQMVILVMGICASVVLGATARLAGEGLTLGFRNRKEATE